jgi:hypothetical protein
VRHAQPTGRGNRPGFRSITLATIVIVAADGLGALGAYLLTGHGGSSNEPQAVPRDCTPSAMLVNPCRPWFGAAANGNPGAPDSRVAQFDYLEKLVGQRLDIFRDYHSAPGSNALGDLPLNANEIQIARRPGTRNLGTLPIGPWPGWGCSPRGRRRRRSPAASCCGCATPDPHRREADR